MIFPFDSFCFSFFLSEHIERMERMFFLAAENGNAEDAKEILKKNPISM